MKKNHRRDAPIEDLLEYWNAGADTNSHPEPSEAVKQRLLDACVGDRKYYPDFYRGWLQTEATAAKS